MYTLQYWSDQKKVEISSGITIINIHLRGQDVLSIPSWYILYGTEIQYCQVKSVIWKATWCFAAGAWQGSLFVPQKNCKAPKICEGSQLIHWPLNSWCIRWRTKVRFKTNANEVCWCQVKDLDFEQYIQNIFRVALQSPNSQNFKCLKPGIEISQKLKGILAHT